MPYKKRAAAKKATQLHFTRKSLLTFIQSLDLGKLIRYRYQPEFKAAYTR